MGGRVKSSCNICDTILELEGSPARDDANCPECHSSARTRAVIHALSVALFGRPMPISEFPELPLKGMGLSDWGYDWRLAEKFAYRNTFYEKEPRLDISDPPEDLWGTLDFLIASDVFEHIAPPVEKGFEGVYRLLKPGGVFVVTVPYLRDDSKPHLERFPSLAEWEVVDFRGSPILVNRTDAGWEVFDDLIFHGGNGVVLEMRHFSHASLLGYLREAGFQDVTDWRDCFEWANPVSAGFPMVARKS
jgi:SAM-dependent methyltransferase